MTVQKGTVRKSTDERLLVIETEYCDFKEHLNLLRSEIKDIKNDLKTNNSKNNALLFSIIVLLIGVIIDLTIK
jgi:hypothetical protein